MTQTEMMKKPIAVLGAGNGGCAMAGDLASRGYAVNLYEHPDFAASFSDLMRDRTITMEGVLGERKSTLASATTDLDEALHGVSLVNLVVPSTAQSLFFSELLTKLRADQTLVVWAGRFGALEFLNRLRGRAASERPVVAETDTLPYGVRKVGSTGIRILYTSKRLLVGTAPHQRREEVSAQLQTFYPEMQAVESVLAAAFGNPALVVYGIGALLNVARIERMKGEFYLFAEGITPAVAEVMYRAFGEMSAVAQALGSSIPQFERSDFDGPLSLEGACFTAPDGAGGFAQMDGPRDVRGRYMMENIGDALAPITEFGDLAGVDTPLLDALVTLGSAVCDVDFRKNGRNFERLGLAGLDRDRVQQIIFGGA